jgi:hypothetical protein
VLKIRYLTHSNMAQRTHGESTRGGPTPEYTVWALMKQRCNNPRSTAFFYYGARGIGVCERWTNSFEAFLADMGRRPSPQHSIDRYPDNDGDYEPGNCRWATKQEQQVNKKRRRRTKMIAALAVPQLKGFWP